MALAERSGIGSCYAMAWYVDSRRGDDANDGRTPETAFKTLHQAAAKAKAGETVFILPGAYDQNLPRQISDLRAANVSVAVAGAH
jgi:hypothetical protein